MSLYYQPSNKMPLGGLALLLLGGSLLAAGLALAYIYAIWYIPFVYINLLLCLGFGLLLGAGLAGLVHAGKLRSPAGAAALGLLVGLAALYLEWAVYLTLLLNSETTGNGPEADSATSFSLATFWGVLTHPGTMWELLRKINETGTWSLKGSTPSGFFLGLIWGLEALIIVGGASLLARMQAQHPFSEATNTWADEETLAHPVGYAHDPAATRATLETGGLHALTPYRSTAAEDKFARLKLHCVPDDSTCHYLTLENVTQTLDKKGKPTQATRTVVEHLAISPAAYQELKRRFGVRPAAAGAGE